MHFCPRALVTYEDAVFFQPVWHGQMLVAQQFREQVRGFGRYDHFPIVLFRHFKEAEKNQNKAAFTFYSVIMRVLQPI
jgi:hypothetical protein